MGKTRSSFRCVTILTLTIFLASSSSPGEDRVGFASGAITTGIWGSLRARISARREERCAAEAHSRFDFVREKLCNARAALLHRQAEVFEDSARRNLLTGILVGGVIGAGVGIAIGSTIHSDKSEENKTSTAALRQQLANEKARREEAESRAATQKATDDRKIREIKNANETHRREITARIDSLLLPAKATK